MAIVAFTSRRMVRILGRGGSIHHGYAEPGHTGLVAGGAVADDAGVAHRRARTEGGELGG